MKTMVRSIFAAAAILLGAAGSLDAGDLKYLGISLGQDARTVSGQLVKQGYEVKQQKDGQIRLAGKLDGYAVTAEINYASDGAIHNLLVRTSEGKVSTNAKDLKSFIAWATKQYGRPTRTTATDPEAYVDDYAEWKMADGKNIVVKSSSDAYVTLIFYQDHKQKHMSLSDLIKGSDRRKGGQMTNEEARQAQRNTEKQVADKSNEVLQEHHEEFRDQEIALDSLILESHRQQAGAETKAAKSATPKARRSLLDILRGIFGKK